MSAGIGCIKEFSPEINSVLLFLSCFACRSTTHHRARGLLWFRFRTGGSKGQRGRAPACGLGTLRVLDELRPPLRVTERIRGVASLDDS
jgi:hypothetical protein